MRPIYCRLDVDFWSSPKVAAAGHKAAILYQILLGLNTKHKCNGRLPLTLLSPGFLGSLMAHSGVLTRGRGSIKHLIQRLVEARMVEVVEEDGSIVITGWDESWQPRTSTERVRKHRANKQNGTFPKRGVTPLAEQSRACTPQAPLSGGSGYRSASPPEPEPDRGTSGPPEPSALDNGERFACIEILKTFPGLSYNPVHHGRAVSAYLDDDGSPAELQQLADIAQLRGQKPAGLLLTWITWGSGQRKDVIAEDAELRKQSRLKGGST